MKVGVAYHVTTRFLAVRSAILATAWLLVCCSLWYSMSTCNIHVLALRLFLKSQLWLQSQRLSSQPPTTCTANLLCLRRHHITSLLMHRTLELDFGRESSLRYLWLYGLEAGNKIAAFSWDKTAAFSWDNLRIANNARSTCLVLR